MAIGNEDGSIRSLDRRSFLKAGAIGAGAVFAGGWLAACSSDSKSTAAASSTTAKPATLTDIAFQLGWLKTPQWEGSYIADTKGYYAANGLKVDLLAGGPTTSVEPIVVSGKAIVGNSVPTATATAILQGAGLRIVAAGYQKDAFDILSMPTKPINTPKDMEGKKIGIQVGNSAAFDAFMKINNVDKSKVQIVPLQFDAIGITNGTVDGHLGIYTNEPGALKLKGFDTVSMLWSDHGYNLFFDTYVVTKASLDDPKERAKLVSFFKAEIKGWQDAVVDKTTSVDLTLNKYGKDLGLDPAQVALEYDAQNLLVINDYTKAHGLFTMDPSYIEKNVATLKTAGINITADQLFDTTLLTEVFDGKTTI